ncbi:hypothetical protein LXL04_034419 [Taraxacum kok-saghyz]
MSSSRTTVISDQERSTRASINSGVCKGWKAPFHRRYYGCRYWPDEKEECGYFDWYDDEVSAWYKDLLNELKPKKKKIRSKEEIGNPRLLYLVKVMIWLLLLLVVLVFILGGLIVYYG